MRIAQVAPLFESVPPKLYGGTERVVSYLTEELVRQGHEVTLFASGDSVTGARLVPACDEALRLCKSCVDPLTHHLAMIEEVYSEKHKFDLIHFHVDYIHFPVTRREGVRSLTTLHGRLDIPDLPAIYRSYPEMPVVSISNAQRAPLPWLNWQATVYHGLPYKWYSPTRPAGGYLAFLGRISPEKNPVEAIEIARRAGMTIKIAAKVDRADREYFEDCVQPLLAQPHVEFVGEIGTQAVPEFLGRAAALVFPINWPEPFGLVTIESMACGTPVIAYPNGSVPELIDDGVTGFLVNDAAEAARAVRNLPQISRRGCYERFLQRFGAERMANDYLAVYRRLLEDDPEALTLMGDVSVG
jgi:glycosyltransferase involved in cell wall biosynthesis